MTSDGVDGRSLATDGEMPRDTIRLPPALRQKAQKAVGAGYYESRSAFYREAIRAHDPPTEGDDA